MLETLLRRAFPITNAIKVFWWALHNSKTFNLPYFRLVKSMMEFLEETVKENHPMGSKVKFTPLGRILYDTPDNSSLLHLWCGVADKGLWRGRQSKKRS